MAVKKFYSNKAKAGWSENPDYKPCKKGEKQKENQKKFFSWGYDIDLEPIEWDAEGKPKRNRKRESGFDKRKTAEAAAGRIRLAEKNSRYDLTDRKTFPLLRELFQKRISTIVERQEKVRALRVLQMLLDELHEKEFTNMRLDELKTAHIHFYIDARKRIDPDIKDETINRDLRTVRATLNQAKNLYPDLENFIPPKVPFLKVDKSRRETILQSTEVEAIVVKLMSEQKKDETQNFYLSRYRAGLLFALASVTGARPGELVALKESDILIDLGVLRITGKKTRYRTAKTVRYFPLIDIVRSILWKALQIKYPDYIFTRQGTLTNTYYSRIKKACEDVGLKYGRKTVGGIIPYDLRHTATTLLMQSGADFETVKSITGQSQSTLWHYTHANKNSIDRAVSVLANFAEKSLEKTNNGLGLDKESKLENLSLLLAANN